MNMAQGDFGADVKAKDDRVCQKATDVVNRGDRHICSTAASRKPKRW